MYNDYLFMQSFRRFLNTYFNLSLNSYECFYPYNKNDKITQNFQPYVNSIYFIFRSGKILVNNINYL